MSTPRPMDFEAEILALKAQRALDRQNVEWQRASIRKLEGSNNRCTTMHTDTMLRLAGIESRLRRLALCCWVLAAVVCGVVGVALWGWR